MLKKWMCLLKSLKLLEKPLLKKINKKQKVSNEDVKHIKEMKAEGIAVEDIAKKFNVSRKTIYYKLKL